MGRWKDNGQGQAYFDQHDTGPDQIAAPTPQAPVSAPPFDGGSEGPGGITGRAQQPDFIPMPGGGGMPNGPMHPLPGGYKPGVPGDQKIPNIFELFPGVDGTWSGSIGAPPQTVEDFLKLIHDRWGIGTGGEYRGGPAPVTPPMTGPKQVMPSGAAMQLLQKASQPVPTDGVMGGPNQPRRTHGAGGLALGALFGR